MSYFNAKEVLTAAYDDYLDAILLCFRAWCKLHGLKEDCLSSWNLFLDEKDVLPRF